MLPTNYRAGADAEVRESNPSQNRGTSTEIGTRVVDSYAPGDGTGLDGSDRSSVIYLQFDLTPWASGDVSNAVLRLTYRNTILNGSRIGDTDGASPDFGQAGFASYGIFGASFDESTISYANAPGLAPDGDIGTLDVAGTALHLGFAQLPPIGTQNHLPVGGAFDFGSTLYAPSNGSVPMGDVDVGGTPVASIPGDVQSPGDPAGELIEGTSWTSVDVETFDGNLTLTGTCADLCGLAGLQLRSLPEPAITAALASGSLLLALVARSR